MEENNLPKNKNEMLLNDVYKNIKTGLQTINLLTNKIFSQSLKEFVAEQYSDYDLILQEIKEKSKTEDVVLKDLNWFKKAGMWTSVNMNTLVNESTEHIAQMLILGTVMGVVDMIKAIDNNPNADEVVIKIAYNTKNMQEKHYDNLKKFLTKEPSKFSENFKESKPQKENQNEEISPKKRTKSSSKSSKTSKSSSTKKS